MRVCNANNRALVSIEGFLAQKNKSVSRTIVNLGPRLTVFYGRNGSGKSALLESLTEDNLILSFEVNTESDELELDNWARGKFSFNDIRDATLEQLLAYFSWNDTFTDYPWPTGHQDQAGFDIEHRPTRISEAFDSWLYESVSWLTDKEVRFPENLLALQIFYILSISSHNFQRTNPDLIEPAREAVTRIARKVRFLRKNILIAGADPSRVDSYARTELQLIFDESEILDCLPDPSESDAYDDILQVMMTNGVDRIKNRSQPFWLLPAWQTAPKHTDSVVIREQPLEIALNGIRFDDKNFLTSIENVILVRPNIVKAAEDWAAKANYFLQLLLEGAPQLYFWIEEPTELTLSSVVLSEWRAKAGESRSIALSELSTAERRWTSFALQLTNYATNFRHLECVLVIDEPESHLHRRAERHLANGLLQISKELDIKICVATHSPLLLLSSDTHLIHVYREIDNSTALSTLDTPSISTLDIFGEKHGLNRSDLLQLVKWFIVVEGEHDRILISEWLPELPSLGAHILAMRGIGNESSSEATSESQAEVRPEDWQMIYRFSEANVLLIVDGNDGEEVLSLWGEIRDLPFSEASKLIQKFRSGKGSRAEKDWIATQMEEAISGGFAHRLTPYALNKRDIIQYLDPRLLGPHLREDPKYSAGNPSVEQIWKRIVTEWRRNGAGKSFKAFSREVLKLKINPRSLSRAARASLPDGVPGEIKRIAEILR